MNLEGYGSAAVRRVARCSSCVAAATLIAACGGSSGGVPATRAPRPHPRRAGPHNESRATTPRLFTIGTSAQGRAIKATLSGDQNAPRRILVVGCVHGDETAGEAVADRLRGVNPPPKTAIWIVREFNPDGCRAGTRQNARGVDLNRNSPWHWSHVAHPGGTFYSGAGPLSEPESQAINSFIKRVRPDLSIWYHQHAGLIDASGGDPSIEKRYASLVGLPFKAYGHFPGSITSWQNATFPHSTAFVVELPGGSLSATEVAAHVRAVLAVAGGG
jgi:murein peptide amidase A